MTTILIKKKDTAGVPAAGDLTNAAGGTEIAVNTATKRIYTKDSGGNVVELGTNPSAITGNLLFSPDNTLDIGASGTSRPRSLFLGTNITVGSLTSTRVPYASTGGLLVDSANMTFNGTDLTVSGAVNAGTINATTLDLTNLEVTNIKAKDGTAGMQIADSTGVVSFTSNPVLSGGTANGVAYLNGSKVLTTGSELTTNGSTNLTVPAEVFRTSATSYMRLAGGSGAGDGANVLAFGQSHASAPGRLVLSAVGTGDLINATINGAHLWQINSSEQMRLTSTGLGIGTTSPSSKLHVNTAGNTTAGGITLRNGSNQEHYWYLSSNTTSTFQIGSGSGAWTWVNSNGELMRLDASGTLMVKTTTARANITTDADLVTQNGLGILATSTTYGQGSQYIRFFNSAAAYAGSISQTAATGIGLYSASDLIFGANSAEQMRLSGSLLYTAAAINVAIGTTSVTTGTKFNVTGNNVTFTPNTAGKDTHTFSTGAADVGTYSIKNNTTVNVLLNAGGTSYFNGGNVAIGATTSSQRLFVSNSATNAEGFRVLQTTGGRTSGGALGLFYDDQAGTTQPTLQVIQNGTGDILQLFDGGAQVVTVKDGGNLLVGGTAQSGTANQVAVFSANKFGLSIIDTTAQAAGVGGALNLGGNYRSAGDAQAFCRVAAAKENSTDANFAYAMTFATTPDGGTFTERARITSGGALLVAQTAIGNGGTLSVNGSISIGTSTTGTQSSMAKDTTQLTASVSTSATTIYTDISSGMSSASAGYFIIYGNNNAGAGFMDVVIAKASGTPVVVSSSTVEGSPPARTYSVSSFALRLTMASGTFNINLKATVIGFPF
jgi:hypothetical protein